MFQEELLMLHLSQEQEKKKKIQETGCRLEDFSITKTLGKGAFGEVFLAKNKCFKDFNVALKVVNKVSSDLHREHNIRVWNEFYVHIQIRHPFIVTCYDTFCVQNSVYFVLELVPNGTLWERWNHNKKLPENEVAKYVAQIASALQYCHYLEFCHGDVKPENILLDHNYNAKLSDFGRAWPFGVYSNYDPVATLDYTPPEVLRFDGAFTGPGDVWSLGVLTYQLIVGELPFYSSTSVLIKARIKMALFNETPLSKTTKAFISGMLAKKPGHRLSPDQIISHEWIISRYADISHLPIYSSYERLRLAINSNIKQFHGFQEY